MFELIKKYLQDNGISNYSKFLLRDDGQGVYIAEWNHEIDQPNFSEEEGKLFEAKSVKIAQCKAYLKSTDWQAIRLAETNEPMKTGVEANRALARSLQDDINACTTLEELEAINTEF